VRRRDERSAAGAGDGRASRSACGQRQTDAPPRTLIGDQVLGFLDPTRRLGVSTFELKLDRPRGLAPREEAKVPVNILVADDSMTMRRILELTFAGEDARVTSVEGGDAAVAKAVEIAPDVVLADASMSTDGYRIATAIKSTPGLERTAVIVLASQKHPYDEAKGRAAGVDDHVVKPFDTQHVIDKVKRVMSQPRAAAPKQASAQQAPAAAAQRMNRPGGTMAFERSPAQHAAPQAAPARPAPAQQAPAHAPARAQAPAALPMVAAATSAGVGDMAQRLDGLGLTSEQVQGVLALSREVIEKVVWEVVPDLAETLIREEIRRLTQ
jgi:CheY-like chemotaxis protein